MLIKSFFTYIKKYLDERHSLVYDIMKISYDTLWAVPFLILTANEQLSHWQ